MTSDRVLECADTSALWDDATCRVGEKRRHVAALQIAASWCATRVKFACRVIAGGTPESSNAEYWDGNVPWLTPVDLGNEHNDRITESKRMLTEAGVRAAGLERLPAGSVVISTRAPIGSVGLLACEAVTNQGCKTVVPDSRKLDSRFAFYFALHSAETLQSLGLGTTFLELSTYSLKNLRISLPSSADQQRIAAYLDVATGKIDRLMGLRRRQMELLREQRAALILQVVTGHLDCGDTSPLSNDATCRVGKKSADMSAHSKFKDSGIPWLGQMPEHWHAIPIGHLAKLLQTGPFGSQLHSDEYIEDGTPLVNPSHMVNGEIVPDSQCTVSRETAQRLSRHALQVDDIVFARRGELGRCALVGQKEIGWLCGTGSLLMRPRGALLMPAFLVTLFGLKRPQEAWTLDSVGSTMDNLNTSILARTKVPLPPRVEQEAILAHIHRETAKLDGLHRSYERQLALLAEYRAALIHECVTGQRPAPACAPGAGKPALRQAGRAVSRVDGVDGMDLEK